MLDAVLRGLQAADEVAGAKRRRAPAAEPPPSAPALARAPEAVNPPRFAFPAADGVGAGWLVSLSGSGADVDVEYFSHAVTSMREETAAAAAAASAAFAVPDAPSLVEVTGRANFATVACAGLGVGGAAGTRGGGAAAAPPQSAWYFEVEMVTDGVVQVGWAAPAFVASSDEGDGVGDHAASWAFDGARGLAWAGGENRPFGGEPWSAGDVVGCLLELQAAPAGGPGGARISYSLNGADLGAAHVLEPPLAEGALFPVISLEAGEVCRWNLGGRGFAYAPTRTAFAPVVAAVTPTGVPVPAALSCGAYVTREREEPLREPAAVAAAAAASTGAPARPAPSPAKSDSASLLHAAAAAAAPPLAPPRPDLSALPGLTSAAAMTSVRSFEAAGFTLADLKAELVGRGLKAGGTYAERCERLLAVRGLAPEQVPPKLRGEGFPGPLLLQGRQL